MTEVNEAGIAKPSIGRAVHYVSYGTPGGEYPSVCRAATITEVTEGTQPQQVGLCVMNPEGLFFNRAVPFGGTERDGGTWHWPERVGQV